MKVSNVFSEFISERCEEIILQDEPYKKFNNEILILETEFKKTLSPEQIKEYNKMEEISMQSIAYAVQCTYNACLEDIKNMSK
jgi:hypothetical protein